MYIYIDILKAICEYFGLICIYTEEFEFSDPVDFGGVDFSVESGFLKKTEKSHH